jgi:hypothetical protein
VVYYLFISSQGITFFWHVMFYQITPMGGIGGRAISDVPFGKEVIAFKENTVSRRHFEVYRV